MHASDNAFSFGYRVVGPITNDRRLIDWPAAFGGYAACDTRAEVDRQSFLSAFCFGSDFQAHLAATGSPKGYAGATWAPWIWFDIDHADLTLATREARRLASGLADRYKLDGDELLLFFSGSKGFHIGLPITVCGSPKPSETFHKACRKFAEAIATRSSVAIDSGIYDAVRAFRAPNSRHPKTGAHKRRLAYDELLCLSVDRIIELAASPEPFDLPEPALADDRAVSDWAAAVASIDAETQAATARRSSAGTIGARLNRSTLDFIRDGALSGGTANDQERGAGRHRLLFSAAANLAELGASLALAEALLTEAALDSGLTPSDVRRQIRCGIEHKSHG